jgi:hypothetical protein
MRKGKPMKAMTIFEQETFDKSIDMLMKAIAESNVDLGNLLIILKKANEKLDTSTKSTLKAA